MAILDWCKPDLINQFKDQFKGLVYEVACSGCGAVTPVILEEGSFEHAEVQSARSGYSHGTFEIAVRCARCTRVTQEVCPWDRGGEPYWDSGWDTVRKEGV